MKMKKPSFYHLLFTAVLVTTTISDVQSFLLTSLVYPRNMNANRHCPSLVPTNLRDSRLYASSSSTLPTDDPRVEPRCLHKLSIPLPLGLILEEMDTSDTAYGVAIIGISPEGNVAKLNSEVFSNIRQYDPSTIGEQCVCIRDKIISVNGVPCHDKSLDYIMETIMNSKSTKVTLEIGRIQQSTVINYSNGICISAKPGESYGFLAQKSGIHVEYECRTGNCLTCQQWMEFPEKMNSSRFEEGNLYRRTILNCVGSVPRGYVWLRMLVGGADISD